MTTRHVIAHLGALEGDAREIIGIGLDCDSLPTRLGAGGISIEKPAAEWTPDTIHALERGNPQASGVRWVVTPRTVAMLRDQHVEFAEFATAMQAAIRPRSWRVWST